jgi:hypothetical protein
LEDKKHIILIVPRGEAVRNFLYSRVTVLSIVDDAAFVERLKPYTDRVIKLNEFKEKKIILFLRTLIHDSHFMWLKSFVAVNFFQRTRKKAAESNNLLKYNIREFLYKICAHPFILRWLTLIENELTWILRPDNYFVDLFKELKPDLVFNTSHIHGVAGELPSKIAHKMGIPLAGFVFSWDNLSSRSRITVPYDYFFVWTPDVKRDLLRIYPFVKPANVFVSGSPQLDYHFQDDFILSREELAGKIGYDPTRPFILYTTGIDRHWPEEHITVARVIKLMKELDLPQKPQLVVRLYAKGTSTEMLAIKDSNIEDVYFPPVEWDEVTYTPSYNDLSIYSSLLRHTSLGINGASTITLELFMFGKPVINLGFDPEGSNIDFLMRYERNILFDHYQPVSNSGGTSVAYSYDDIWKYMNDAFLEPQKHVQDQKRFLNEMFADILDGKAGERIGKILLNIVNLKAVIK